MNIKTIAGNIARNTGASYSILPAVSGQSFAQFSFDDPDVFGDVLSIARRIKTAHVEHNRYTYSIQVFELSAWDAIKAYNAEKMDLVEGYWQAYHSGGKSAADRYYHAHLADYNRLGL